MPSSARVIRDAYAEILNREPDPGGLDSHDRMMNQGTSESAMREGLMRSREFALRFPDASLPGRIGMNVHVPPPAIVDDLAQNLGVPSIRLDFDWFRIEPERGVFRWEDLDRAVARAPEPGLAILPPLASP